MLLDSKDFSKKELISILEVVEAGQTCDTEEALKQILKQAKELISADYCICGLGHIVDSRDISILAIVNESYPKEWLQIYELEKLYKVDPVINHHYFQFLTTQLWSDVFKQYKDNISTKFLNRASEFGLKHGISNGAFVQEESNGSIFSFASNKNVFKAHHKRIINILSLHLHRALIKVYNKKLFM